MFLKANFLYKLHKESILIIPYSCHFKETVLSVCCLWFCIAYRIFLLHKWTISGAMTIMSFMLYVPVELLVNCTHSKEHELLDTVLFYITILLPVMSLNINYPTTYNCLCFTFIVLGHNVKIQYVKSTWNVLWPYLIYC